MTATKSHNVRQERMDLLPPSGFSKILIFRMEYDNPYIIYINRHVSCYDPVLSRNFWIPNSSPASFLARSLRTARFSFQLPIRKKNPHDTFINHHGTLSLACFPSNSSSINGWGKPFLQATGSETSSPSPLLQTWIRSRSSTLQVKTGSRFWHQKGSLMFWYVNIGEIIVVH